MLFDESCEFGTHKGLGLVSGNVVAIPPGRVIPHMGWNKVVLPEDMALFAGLEAKSISILPTPSTPMLPTSSAKVAYTDYGFKLPASIQKGNIYGTQFHPEKSGKQGLQVLAQFRRNCRREG